MIFTRIRHALTLLVLIGLPLVAWQLTTTPTHADGGAPNLAYVSGGAQGIAVIDVAKQAVDRSIKLSSTPEMILLSPDGRFLYVTQPAENRLSVIGAKEGNLVCSVEIPGKPSLLALDPNVSKKLYVAGNGTSGVREVDPTDCKVIKTYPTDGPVYGLAIANVASSISQASGNQLWVASGKALTVFDDLKGERIQNIAVDSEPRYVVIPPGATVYATTREGSVIAVDLNTRNVIKLISGGEYGPMDYDAMTGQVYVPDQRNKQLVVLAPVNAGSTPPHQPVRTIDLGVAPASVAITNDGQLGFVALVPGDVAMLDIPGKQLVNTFHVGGSPHFIITGVYPPAVGTTPQQADFWGTVITIAAYVFVAALLIVPIVLFRRYSKGQNNSK